jgi:hypothetical protein
MAKKIPATKPYTEEAHTIGPRDVEFDWTDVPLHYIPGEPFATQFWNIMHLAIPLGEKMMAGCLAEALPYIDDPRLREEAVGFIGQESMHASSHESYHEHLASQGIDIEPVVRNIETMLQAFLGDHKLRGRAKEAWLKERLAFYAAAEHFTAVVGQWMLEADAWDEAGMHPMMKDLLRWHGAEEVEHRNVLFDVYQHVDGSYSRRVRMSVVASLGLFASWMVTADYLMRQDPSSRWWKPWPVQMLNSVRKRLLPGPWFFVSELPSYLRPAFHPSQMGTLDAAIAYLATSPAARAAEQH